MLRKYQLLPLLCIFSTQPGIAMETNNFMASQLLQQCVNEKAIDYELAHKLLLHQANPFLDPIDANHRTAVMISLDNSALWQLLVAHAQHYKQITRLFIIAVQYNRFSKVAYLINQHRIFFDWIDIQRDPILNFFAQQLVFKATYTENMALLRYFVRTKNISANCLDKASNTPLFIAVKENKKEAVDFLLKNGALVNIHNNEGSTPLLEAVRKAPSTIIALLLNNGADVNLCNSHTGTTPLIATAHHKGSTIINLLVHKGAQVNTQDDEGITPLMQACRRGELISMKLVTALLDAGANPTVRSNKLKMAAAYAKDTEVRIFLTTASEDYEDQKLNKD